MKEGLFVEFYYLENTNKITKIWISTEELAEEHLVTHLRSFRKPKPVRKKSNLPPARRPTRVRSFSRMACTRIDIAEFLTRTLCPRWRV